MYLFFKLATHQSLFPFAQPPPSSIAESDSLSEQFLCLAFSLAIFAAAFYFETVALIRYGTSLNSWDLEVAEIALIFFDTSEEKNDQRITTTIIQQIVPQQPAIILLSFVLNS